MEEQRIHWLSVSFLIVAIAGFMFVLAHLGFLYQLEMFGLDPLLGAHTFKDEQLRIVEITDDDYAEIFDETSPLKQSTLEEVVLKIMAAKPRLLVVDLDVTPKKRDLDDPRFVSLPVEVQKKLPPGSGIVIWPVTVTKAPGRDKSDLILSPLPQPFDPAHLGIPVFPRERDGMVRSYAHLLPVLERGLPKLWPSLPWQAFRGGLVESEPAKESHELERVYFNFSGDRYTFDHTDLTSIRDVKPQQLEPAFRGKTVLLGGKYAAARDEYFTPVGPLPGVDLIAYAMETEKRGGGMRELKETEAILIDILLGFALVLVDRSLEQKGFRLRIAVLLALAIILPILGSYVVFNSWNLWLSFVPVVIGALVHIALDEYKKIRKELAELRSAHQPAVIVEMEGP